MQKVLKTAMLPPNSGVVVTKKQFFWLSAVSPITDSFSVRTELSVVSKLNKKPIALVDIASKNPLTNEEKTFVRDILKPKVVKIASSLMEMLFKLILRERMLFENGISEHELFEHYPNLPQWVVILNNSDQDVEIEIPKKFILPNIVSASLV
jgi:hypothetical protein